ncbi:MAG: glycosyltransferase family 39 protein [Candidatus Taylorbacteria bacterium]|nr:glycosyltransferase family 39 protein [Candidatus Taylorbacteria bacterium]
MYSNRNRELLVIVSIVAIAVFFRFYQLDSIPPGLWPDEAANGVDALKALDERDFKIFYPANNGREGLFINIQAISVGLFGPEPWSLRVVSAVFGTLTVLGLYLLVRHMYDWRTAAIASFFLSVSFWHVNFSRIGFRAIMLPFILVWAFYFLWRGLRSGQLKEFFIAGVIGGMGFYTYFSFRIVPLIALILFWNYWTHLKTHYSHSKYEQTRNRMLRGFAVLMLTVIIIALPLLFYFYTHPEDFLKREGRPISVFDQARPGKELGLSIVKTLAMFNFTGDYNQRHNIPGWPQLSLPIGILFAIGFLREFGHWLKRKPGHFSTVHTFLFSWFFIMLLPGFLSTEAPHALRTIGVIPVVMIFAAHGFRWLINLVRRYHHLTDLHAQTDKLIYKKESGLLLVMTVTIFFVSLGFLEYSRYFRKWGSDPGLNDAFTQRYVDIADYLKNQSSNVPRYVLVNEGDVYVDGVSNNAQTIKFLTRTHSQQCSVDNNIYYLKDNALQTIRFPGQFILIPLKDSPGLGDELFWKFNLYPEKHGSFVIYKPTNY